jgi:hypothetical protein
LLCKDWTDTGLAYSGKEKFSMTCYLCNTYTKVYDCSGSVAKKKIFGHEPPVSWCQDELIGGKLSVIK